MVAYGIKDGQAVAERPAPIIADGRRRPIVDLNGRPIAGVPPGAKSLALIVDDPDAPDPAAPKRTWVHWVLYNVPADLTRLPEAVDRDALPDGALEGVNDWKRTGYGGPCPPVGRHRYFFKLYALDVTLPDLNHPTKAALEAAMAGHVLATAELVGKYQKARTGE